MGDNTITKIETSKRFDTNNNRWGVIYNEVHHENDGKKEWNWASENEYFFETEAEADVKLQEVQSTRDSKEITLGLK